MSQGVLSGGVNQPGCLMGLPNHILEGESSPVVRGVSFHIDQADGKSSPDFKHFIHSLLNVFTVDSARPLL